MSNVRVKAQGTARSGLAFLLAIIMVMSLMSPRFSWANNADGPSNSAITPPIVSDAGIESEEDSDESISDIDSDDVASDAGIESEIDNPNVSDSSIAQDADTSSETTRSGLSVQGDTEALEITGELENDSILYRSRFIGYDHANKGQSSLIYHPSVMKSISGGEAFFAQDQDPVIYFTDGNRAVYCFEPENGLITPNPAIGDSTNKLTFVQKEMLAYILANGQNEYAGYFNNNMDPKPANGYGEAVENANAPALQRQIATQLATWLVGSNHYKSDDVVRKAVIPAGTGGTGAGFAPTPYIAQIAGELLDKAYAALTSSPKLEPSVSVMTPSGTSYTVDLTDENKAISTSLDRSLWQTAILNALKAKGLSGSFNGNILTITGDPGVGTEAYGGTTINATIPASNYSKALLAYFSGNSSSFQGMVTARLTALDSNKSISFHLYRKAQIELPFDVTKTIDGNVSQLNKTDLTGFFEFELYESTSKGAIASGATPLLTASNETFNTNNIASVALGSLPYNEADIGEHYYVIKEKIPAPADQGYWRYDSTGWLVTVTVSWEGLKKDRLEAGYQAENIRVTPDSSTPSGIIGGWEPTMNFKNTYDSPPELSIPITKTIFGDLNDLDLETLIGKFEFGLYELSDEWNFTDKDNNPDEFTYTDVPSDYADGVTPSATISNGGFYFNANNGGFSAEATFGPIKYTEGDVGKNHYYLIKESVPADLTDSDWEYDTKCWLVWVVVEKDETNSGVINAYIKATRELSKSSPTSTQSSKSKSLLSKIGDGIVGIASNIKDAVVGSFVIKANAADKGYIPVTPSFTNTYTAPIYDAALRKWVSNDYRPKNDGSLVQVFTNPAVTLAEQDTPSATVPVAKGDIVKYTIKVYNQGTKRARIPQIVDYLPTDGSLSLPNPADYVNYPSYSSIVKNDGWSIDPSNPYKLVYNYKPDLASSPAVIASGAATYTGDVNVILEPGASKEVSVYLVVNSAPKTGTIDNFAEISEFTDTDDEDVDDVDSTPDDEDDNDNFNPDEDDNEVNEDGKNNEDEDEDDHDIAKIDVAELGSLVLTKHVTDPSASASTNNTFDFRITDANGDAIDLTDVDYDFIWHPASAGYASQNPNVKRSQGIITLKKDECVEIQGLKAGARYNVEEISATGSAVLGDYKIDHAKITAGVSPLVTGSGVSVTAIELTSSAITEVTYTNARKIYDAALRKWIPKVERTITEAGVAKSVEVYNRPVYEYEAVPVQVGDKVTFAIDLFNQCENPLTIKTVTDYIGLGFSYHDADNTNNGNWTYSGGSVTYTGDLDFKAWDGSYKDAAQTIGNYPTTQIAITLRVEPLYDNAGEKIVGTERYNYAEITKITDENDKIVEDIDSVPDDDKYNDGDIDQQTDVPTDEGTNPIKDNEIEEHGVLPSDGTDGDRDENVSKGGIGEPDTGYDEDDHDYARVYDRVYDAALRKWVTVVSTSGSIGSGHQVDSDYEVDGPTPDLDVKPPLVQIGDYVTYKIRVFNQGDWTAKITKISDYLPVGLEFVTVDALGAPIPTNAVWVATKSSIGQDIISYIGEPLTVFSRGAVDLDGTPLDAQTLEVILKVLKPVKDADGNIVTGTYLNGAEISGFTDDEDNPVDDEDSTPDDEDNETPKDNEVDEKPPGDEDDHDIAEVIPKVYDVALRKWVTTIDHGGAVKDIDKSIAGPTGKVDPPTVYVGDIITYNIRLFNQTENPVTLTAITDYLPDGLELVTTGTIGANWTITGTKTVYNNAGTASTYTSISYIGPDIYLDGYDGTYGTGADEQTIQIQARVKNPSDITKATLNLDNYAEVTEMIGEEDTPVKDEDSTPDGDIKNDEFDYDKDNEIDEHKQGDDAKNGDDEDDHDIARIVLSIIIQVEVDKDTIRRTASAYKSLPNKEGIDNVGEEEERYRYDFNFRSTSTIETEEFIVEDRLENANRYRDIIVEEFWTPIVAGDINGTYNIWYQTNKTDPYHRYADYENLSDNKSIPYSSSQYPNLGYKPWIEDKVNPDNDGLLIQGIGLSTRESYRLTVANLGLDSDEYLTAIRLEYGAVKPGFTSKNTRDVSVNREHRTEDGQVNLPPTDKKIDAPLQAKIEKVGQLSLSFAPLSIAPLSKTIQTFATGIELGDDFDYVDWTPAPSDGYYNKEIAEDTEVVSGTYLVSATRAMSEEDIVSSVEAHIARDTMVDKDQDAVLTKVVQTFETNPDNPVIDKADIEESSYVTPPENKTEIVSNGATEVPPATPREGPKDIFSYKTGDPMQVTLLYIIIVAAIISIVALVLLRPKRKRNHREEV